MPPPPLPPSHFSLIPYPFLSFLGEKRWEMKKKWERQWDISTQQKLEWCLSKYRILSGISFYKLCFLKQHRSISASLAFLKIILLIALLTFKFCYRRQVWCSQNVLSMPHQYLHLLLHIILVRPDMLQEVLVTECPQMLRL